MAVQQTESPSRILMIDDDVKLCRLIRDYLQPLGYHVSVAHTGQDGLTLAAGDTFAAVILDVMLPGINGLEVLRELRRTSNVPVLMLTGRGEKPDRIVGLELGADDYLPKTFSTRELLARLRAVIRRSEIATQAREQQRDPVIIVDNLSINTGSRSAELDGTPLQLTAVEFDILTSLARAAGLVKTREQLLLEVADRDFEVFDRSIDVHVSSLRKKLGDDAKAPRFIGTIRSVGRIGTNCWLSTLHAIRRKCTSSMRTGTSFPANQSRFRRNCWENSGMTLSRENKLNQAAHRPTTEAVRMANRIETGRPDHLTVCFRAENRVMTTRQSRSVTEAADRVRTLPYP